MVRLVLWKAMWTLIHLCDWVYGVTKIRMFRYLSAAIYWGNYVSTELFNRPYPDPESRGGVFIWKRQDAPPIPFCFSYADANRFGRAMLPLQSRKVKEYWAPDQIEEDTISGQEKS